MRQQFDEDGRLHAARSAINDKLLESLQSDEPIPVTAATWAQSRARIAARILAAAKKPRWTFDPNR